MPETQQARRGSPARGASVRTARGPGYSGGKTWKDAAEVIFQRLAIDSAAR